MSLEQSHLQCHCGSIYEPATLLDTAPREPDDFCCHCNICRHSTGSLATWYVALKGRPSDHSLSNATGYNATKSATRYFCKTCGCHVFDCVEREDRWVACAGAVETECADEHAGVANGDRYGKEERNVTEIMYHEHLADAAADGGLAPYLTHVGGRTVPSYYGDIRARAQKPIPPEELLALRENADTSVSARGDDLKIACHCGGVELRLAAPSYDESSPRWYIPSDRTKYSAHLCSCRSCRLTLGFTLQPWVNIPRPQLSTIAGKEMTFGLQAKETVQIAQLKHYQSSKTVSRGFCSGCGATICYQSSEEPHIIKVSAGVVRSKVGNVLVGEWLEWDHKAVDKRDEAVDESLAEAWLRG